MRSSFAIFIESSGLSVASDNVVGCSGMYGASGADTSDMHPPLYKLFMNRVDDALSSDGSLYGL
jgi:hypothetical protein